MYMSCKLVFDSMMPVLTHQFTLSLSLSSLGEDVPDLRRTSTGTSVCLEPRVMCV
jgi:hypothetical protein